MKDAPELKRLDALASEYEGAIDAHERDAAARAATEAPERTTAGHPGVSELSGTDIVIRQKCAGDWPNDFSVRAYCEPTQRAAVDELQGRAMDAGDELTIRRKCADDWPTDYSLRNYCERQQLNALRQLGQ